MFKPLALSCDFESVGIDRRFHGLAAYIDRGTASERNAVVHYKQLREDPTQEIYKGAVMLQWPGDPPTA